MDYLKKLNKHVRIVLIVTLLLNNLLLLAIYAIALDLRLSHPVILGVMLGSALVLIFTIAPLIGRYVMKPVSALWHSLEHVSPTSHEFAVPKSVVFWLGKDLVADLTHQIYQLASEVNTIEPLVNTSTGSNLNSDKVATNLPLPLVVLDKYEQIIFANRALLDYIGITAADALGKNVYSVIDMAFSNEQTFDSWLSHAKKSSVTAVNSWERVRIIRNEDSPPLLFDLAASYNKNNPDAIETMMLFFDHSERYSQDDKGVSFVSLAVHELRTPLTLLRGYIEVFEQDLTGKLTPELEGFLAKMKATSQQLNGFINTILHVARVESDQLELKLQKETWGEILHGAVNDLQLRATVRGVKLDCDVADGLPEVGADRMAITEVINNVVENAIKYSGQSKKIVIKAALTKDNLVETTVQDFGVGIPEGVVPHLFTKFTRNHRNRAQIGGTGLGLYLSKSIVGAHGGNIWIRSHEGQGTTVGFTLLPYSQLNASQKQTDSGITRGAHGWIKNHSMYRR